MRRQHGEQQERGCYGCAVRGQFEPGSREAGGKEACGSAEPSTFRPGFYRDTLRVRYLTDDKRVVQFTISAERSDPTNGVIHYKKPIAEALLGAEEGDEVEILVGSYLRPAVLEKIVTRVH